MPKLKIAIAGVGNCASSLVQGLHYYRDARDGEFVPGLMHVRLGGYHISDVEVVAAFDVDDTKVGKDLSDALVAPINNTIKFSDIPQTGVMVQRGETFDGLGKYYKQTIRESESVPVRAADVLAESGTQVLVNYLPVGSERAVRWYMEQALEAGVAVVNCMPVFIAKDARWSQRFADRGLPIVGDDIKAQVGATIVHRVLARLMNDRGVKVERMSQLNVGGNMDFMNMLEHERLESKRISKTDAVVSQLDYKIEPENIHIGPSDYVPWLQDRKWCYLRIEGREFGDVPVNIELKLEVWDSPNSAGVAIDAIRCAQLARDRGVVGALIGPSAYFMKSPPIQYTDAEALDMVESFIAGR
ncbi:inositol-3-phosphate synthase [Candidatus Poribacteria bacterium]|nr:inositol-3-phosphate synthase [Candidatus Poribacteria bacterium]